MGKRQAERQPSGVVCRRQVGYLGAYHANDRAGREAGELVRFPQGQQPLSLVGPGMHGGLGHRLPPVNAVLVAERADLGALGRVGGVGHIGQGDVEFAGELVPLVGWGSESLGAAVGLFRSLGALEQFVEVRGQRDIGEIIRFSSGADRRPALFHGHSLAKADDVLTAGTFDAETLPGEIVPAEPEPAEQDKRPASFWPHYVAEPLAECGNPVILAPAEDFQNDQGGDDRHEAGDGDSAHAHRALTAAPVPSRPGASRQWPGS